MKILFSLLAFCLFASCVHSQEAVDTVSVRVQYRVKYNNSLVTLLLIGIISLVVTNGAALSLSLMVFVWLGIFNLLPICIHYAIYSFISKRTNSKKERPI